MRCKARYLPAFVCLPLMLTACATSGDGVRLAVMPADLRLCFDRLAAPPPGPRGAELSREQMAALVARLKTSEARMSACGRRIVAWYDDQAAAFAR